MEIILFEFNGSVCTLTQGIGTGITLLETGKRDVPSGTPFWIVDSVQLPLDEPTESWEIDAETLGEPDGVGGTYIEKIEEGEE